MKQLYVRIHLKTGAGKFYRCGIAFSREWQKVGVDDATAKRLEEEQMLEVSADVPADYVAEAADQETINPLVSTDPTLRAAAIKDAIARLDKDDAALWTGTGMPKVPAIAAVTGFDVTQAERDAVWAEINKA